MRKIQLVKIKSRLNDENVELAYLMPSCCQESRRASSAFLHLLVWSVLQQSALKQLSNICKDFVEDFIWILSKLCLLFCLFLAPDVVRRPPVQQLWHSQKSCCRVDLFKKYNPSHEEEEERVGVRKSETFQAARFFRKNFLDKVSQFSNLRQMCLKFVDGLKNFQVIQTLFRFSRHFLNRLETFQIIQPLFRSSRDLPDHPDTFQTIQTLSRSSGHIF